MTISLQINADVRGQREVDRLNTSMRTLGRTSDASSRALRALSTVLAGLSFGLIAREITRSSDAMRSLNAQLRATGSSAQVAAGQIGRIAQIAQDTGTAFEGTADVFTRLQRSTREFGASTAQIATATTAIQQSFALAGSSAGEASSSALQLGQALSSGALQGDELRSILENNAVLAGLIADEFGVGVGELRRLGAQGELVSERVFGAILSGSQEINEQFAGFGNLYSQSANRIRNASTLILSSIGDIFDDITGINDSITGFTQGVVNAFNDGRVNRAILDFVRYIREQFTTVRIFIDRVFENLGLGDISDEANRNLALFVVSAGALSAFSAAGTALGVGFRVGFAIASGPARLVRAFAGAIGRQAARTNLGMAGTNLATSLRRGFQTVGLIPTVTAPSRMTSEAVGSTTSSRVRAGIRPIVIPITGVSVLAGRQLGLQTSSRISAGIFPIVQTVAPVSRLAARRVAQTTRGRLTDSVIAAPITGTNATNLRGLGGSIATVIAGGIGSFAGWEVAQSVVDNFDIEMGSFTAIGIQLAGSIIGAITAELAISLAPAIVSAIAGAAITIPVLSITAIVGGIVVGGVSLAEWIGDRVREGVENSSATDSNDLATQRIFDSQYRGMNQLELARALSTALNDQARITASLDSQVMMFPDLEDYLRSTNNEEANQLSRVEGRIQSLRFLITQNNNNARGNATGGIISGPGTGTSDSILARLSDGEFVINARATSEYLPLLEAINSGAELPAFGPGGEVGNAIDVTELTDSQLRQRNRILDDIRTAQENLNRTLRSSDITSARIESDRAVINDPDANPRRIATAQTNIGFEIDQLVRNNDSVIANTRALEENKLALENFDMMLMQGQGNMLFNFDFMEIGMMVQQQLTSSLADAFRTGDFGDVIDNVLNTFTNSIINSFAMNITDSLFDNIGSLFSGGGMGGGGGIASIFGAFFGANTGGVVPTTSYSTPGVDSVPFLLTPGETVIPAGGEGGSGMMSNNTTVNLEVVGDLTATTRREIVQMLPEIINATQATLEERRVLSNA